MAAAGAEAATAGVGGAPVTGGEWGGFVSMEEVHEILEVCVQLRQQHEGRKGGSCGLRVPCISPCVECAQESL